MTRPAAAILADLAAVSERQAALQRELAAALRAAPAEAPARPASAPAEYLTTKDAAALLGVTTRHLERLRAQENGPIPHRIGRAVRYRRTEVEAWGAKYPAVVLCLAPA